MQQDKPKVQKTFLKKVMYSMGNYAPIKIKMLLLMATENAQQKLFQFHRTNVFVINIYFIG